MDIILLTPRICLDTALKPKSRAKRFNIQKQLFSGESIMRNIELRTDRHHKQRKVPWLELFIDLVFVVIIARIAHNFLSDISWGGFGTFIFMFLNVCWMWSSVIYFTERFVSKEHIQRAYRGCTRKAINPKISSHSYIIDISRFRDNFPVFVR